jgi:hypothetical protein
MRTIFQHAENGILQTENRIANYALLNRLPFQIRDML